MNKPNPLNEFIKLLYNLIILEHKHNQIKKSKYITYHHASFIFFYQIRIINQSNWSMKHVNIKLFKSSIFFFFLEAKRKSNL